MLLTLKQIFRLCADKAKAVHKMQEWGVFATEGELKCPECGGKFKLSKNNNDEDGYFWRCCNKVSKHKQKKALCNKRQSIRTKTFLSKSQLSIEQVMMFARLWCKNVELNTIAEEVSISKPTSVDWNSFCREVVISFCEREAKPIGGKNMTVEIDESKFGKRKYNKGHYVEGQWVFGGVCRETGDFFMVPVEHRDGATLLPLIESWILPGSTIISDCWKAYEKLDETMFQHLTVNHSVNYKDPETGAHTNQIEGLWRHVKCRLPAYNRRNEHFVGYLAKFIFLNFCKRNQLDPTVEFFKAAGMLYNPYKDEPIRLLVGENEEGDDPDDEDREDPDDEDREDPDDEDREDNTFYESIQHRIICNVVSCTVIVLITTLLSVI